MPTNDERREVARRIRKKGSISYHSDVYKLVMGKNVPLETSAREDDEALAERLADLIEPEPERTCNRVDIYSLRVGASYKGCSKCHNPLNVLDRYCSRCGAKVVDE